MWPWEHAAVGYLAYSGLARLRGRPPTRTETLVLLVGTQFPDLVDKPLAWSFGVLPTGTSLAHSVLIAVPLVLAVWIVGIHRGFAGVGIAFGIGYLLHLPGDAVYTTIMTGTPPSISVFTWPVGSAVHGSATGPGLFEQVRYYLIRYESFLAGPRTVWYLVAEVLLVGSALLAWVLDGRPGLGR